MASSEDVFKFAIDPIKKNWGLPAGEGAKERVLGLVEELEGDSVADIKAMVEWLSDVANYKYRSCPLPGDFKRARNVVAARRVSVSPKNCRDGEDHDTAKRFLQSPLGQDLASKGYARSAYIWAMKRGRAPSERDIGRIKSSWDLFRKEVAGGKLSSGLELSVRLAGMGRAMLEEQSEYYTKLAFNGCAEERSDP